MVMHEACKQEFGCHKYVPLADLACVTAHCEILCAMQNAMQLMKRTLDRSIRINRSYSH